MLPCDTFIRIFDYLFNFISRVSSHSPWKKIVENRIIYHSPVAGSLAKTGKFKERRIGMAERSRRAMHQLGMFDGMMPIIQVSLFPDSVRIFQTQ
jgi:hypothetical protein